MQQCLLKVEIQIIFGGINLILENSIKTLTQVIPIVIFYMEREKEKNFLEKPRRKSSGPR